MRFDLEDSWIAKRDEARRFARERVMPGAADRDRTKTFPTDLISEAAELGYCGLLVPEEEGGSGLGNFGQCIVLEEVAAACAGTHVTLSVHNSLVSAPIYKFGSDDLKSRYLRDVARGTKLGCYLLTEPGSGSDAAAMKTTGRKDGDHWILNGDKMWITSGDCAQVGIVFAVTEDDENLPDTKRISAFVVDFDDPGISFGKQEPKLGLRASSTVAVFLKDVRVPDGNLLGERGRGFNIAMDLLNGGRVGIAIQSVGIARAALDVAVEALENDQRDRRPLKKSQLARFRVAEMAAGLDAARLLCWRAAGLRDEGRDHIKEASMAKLLSTQVANQTCRAVVELLGEDGYGGARAAERLMRDCRVTELYEGTTEVQKLVISRQLARS